MFSKIGIDAIGAIGGTVGKALASGIGFRAATSGAEILSQYLRIAGLQNGAVSSGASFGSFQSQALQVFRRAIDRSSTASRFRKSRELINSGHAYEREAGVLLQSASLENMLREMWQANHIPGSRPSGIAEHANALWRKGAIDKNEYLMLMKYAKRVRNPAAHGQAEKIDLEEVKRYQKDIDDFYDRHRDGIAPET